MIVDPGPNSATSDQAQGPPAAQRPLWHTIRNRLLEGLLVVLPIVVTYWVIRWLYSTLEKYVIDPLAILVIWKAQRIQGESDLPPWFENIAAPIISIILAIVIVFVCGVFAHTRFRRWVDNLLLRMPLVSHVFDAVRGVLKCFDKPVGQPRTRRIVLVPFPHPGTRLPAIVTSTTTDLRTGRKLLCVYVPKTPIPASGFFLMLPEEDATELNWDVQQTLQAIISGGLTAPSEVSYFGTASPTEIENVTDGSVPVAAHAGS